MVYLALQEMLKRNNKTRYWLVQQLESDYKAINCMVDNKTKGIKFETIDKLCNVFNCTPNDLLKRK